MSDKAEAAYHQWLGAYIAERKGNVDADMLCHSQAAFFDGYAAASADTERLVREAVMATIEEAASTGDGWTIQITDDVGYISTQDASKIGEHQVRFIVERIRALDPESIVQRVMKETANVTEQ